jgi:peptidoglycan/LPS O-acetylase OafA/YrhL
MSHMADQGEQSGAGWGGRLRELDGWRAISVLLVIVHHIGRFQHTAVLSRIPGASSFVKYCGPLGVKVFFVISGFVICRLLILEELRFGRVSLKAFYCRRVLRILPPFYLYLSAIALLLLCGLIHESWAGILQCQLFLYDFKFSQPSWFVGHTWSLAVEEQFYLLFPSMWVLTPKAWRGRLFSIVFLLITVWNLSMVTGHWDTITWNDTRAGFSCISCGVLMAVFEQRCRAIVRELPALAVAALGFILLLHPVGIFGWKATAYESVFVPPAIAVVLLFSLMRATALSRVLCSRPLQAIGVTSYGIYLWQQLFTAARERYAGAGIIIFWLLPLLCAIVPLSYVLLEKPAMRLGRRLAERVRPRSVFAKAAS